MQPYHLLQKNDLPLEIEIHSDPLCVLPAALSKKRAFKRNRAPQKDLEDDPGGAKNCILCNPSLMPDQPAIQRHPGGMAISFRNVAPFLPGDQRIICLWHDDEATRYSWAHKCQFGDFGFSEFYGLVSAAAQLAREFPETPDGKRLQQGLNLIRCIAGFNIGRFAGQSVPHFHLQYGWEVAIAAKHITPELMNLYYSELGAAGLILYQDERLSILVPWTPKGQYHIEVHFKSKYEISQLEDEDVLILGHLAEQFTKAYQEAGIRNMNVLLTGSPHQRIREPFCVQFVPRVNMPAMYEMSGVNVVDTPPESIVAFFDRAFRFSDLMAAARERRSAAPPAAGASA